MPNGTKKICEKCWGTIPALAKDHFLYQKTRNKLLDEGYIDDLISCYVFEKEGPFQHIAHALKYQEYKSLGIELGKQIGELIRNRVGEIDIIVPVPLHRVKYRERGYNQSECIAQGIASVIDKPIIVDAIRRVRHTQTQTKLNLQERYFNMKDAFEILPDATTKLYAKSCLLVDDVITTGATTNSCAKEIFSTGTKTIIVASAALAK
jgi:ComF family protein